MKKIIHLSDLHIGYDDLGQRFNCICTNIIFSKKPAKKYVIVITGDLVETATNPTSYEEAKYYFQRLEAAGFKVLVVPGNHDYGIYGTYGMPIFVDKFKAAFFGDTSITYPKLDIIGKIAFIGLDSMAEELNWDDALFAQGELGNAQLKRLDKMLAQDEVVACKRRVVYLHHHPFDARFLRELKDSKKLGVVLKKHDNVDALLYGHNHAGKIQNGKWSISRCYDAGTTTNKKEVYGYHRVIDFKRDPRWDYDANFHCDY